jgi:hypothetical protein
MRNIVVVLMILLIAILAGCTSISIERPDTVKVSVQTLGSSEITDMTYARNADGIVIAVGSYSNTPVGVPEVIEATGSAITDVTTAGVSSAVGSVINQKLIDPDD